MIKYGRKKKKLYRKEEGKMIAGVCAGVADYFGIDVTIVRLVWVLFTVFVGSGILAYLIALILIPQEPKSL